ncbi:hypothetical protein DFH09DRAFT_1373331 [Mycena vulgaris]|nr:hypothetical protein DFH09DRAFT_1373331 [Mycena vulgaris]
MHLACVSPSDRCIPTRARGLARGLPALALVACTHPAHRSARTHSTHSRDSSRLHAARKDEDAGASWKWGLRHGASTALCTPWARLIEAAFAVAMAETNPRRRREYFCTSGRAIRQLLALMQSCADRRWLSRLSEPSISPTSRSAPVCSASSPLSSRSPVGVECAGFPCSAPNRVQPRTFFMKCTMVGVS